MEGFIRADELYTLDHLKLRLGLTDSSYREMRDSGLPEVVKGKRKYFIGSHVIRWFANASDQGDCRGPAQAVPLLQASVEREELREPE